MNKAAREMLAQALRLAAAAIEHLDDPDGAEPDPAEKLEPGAVERAARRERMRKRGIPVPGE